MKKIAILTADNENLKKENESLNSLNSILEIDVSYLTEKISSLMQEIEDLKLTLGKFVKGKNTLDTILGMKVNFQKEDLGYTPPIKSTPQRPINSSHATKPSSSKYVHSYQKNTMTKFTPPKLLEHVNSYAFKKNHVMRNSNVRRMSRISCYHCSKYGHHICKLLC